MARIDDVDPTQLDPYGKRVFESQAKAWGKPLLTSQLYARRPTIFRSAQGMWAGLAGSGLLPGTLIALLNRRVAAHNGCVF